MGLLDAPAAPSFAGASVATFVADAAPRTLYSYAGPAAEYDSTSNKTFIAYAGRSRFPWATSYDHTTGEFSAPVRISATYPPGAEDNHGPPTICIDNNGYLHVFWGSHNQFQQYSKSTTPRDITAWTTTSLSGITAGTYTHPVVDHATNTIYVPMRAGAGNHGPTYPAHEFLACAKSTDGGATWTDIGPLVNLNAYNGDACKDVYISDANFANGKLHLTWTGAHGPVHDGPRDDVFHAYYNPSTGHMHTVDGTDMGATLTGTQGRVYTHGYCSVPKALVQSDGTIWIVVNEYIAGESSCGYRMIKITSAGTVTTSDTGIRTHHYAHMAGLRVRESGGFEMYVVDGSYATLAYQNDAVEAPFRTGGDLRRYVSTNGTTWTLAERVIDRNASPAQGIENVHIPHNSAPGLKALVQASSDVSMPLLVPIYAVTDQPVKVGRSVSRGGARRVAKRAFVDLVTPALVQVTSPAHDAGWTTVDASAAAPPGATGLVVLIGMTPTSGTGLLRGRLREAGTARRYDATFDVPIVVTGQESVSSPQVVPLDGRQFFEWQLFYFGGSSPVCGTFRVYVVGYIYD